MAVVSVCCLLATCVGPSCRVERLLSESGCRSAKGRLTYSDVLLSAVFSLIKMKELHEFRWDVRGTV